MNINQCDEEVYQNGEWVAVIADKSPKEIEKIVNKVAKQTGFKVDWYWIGGGAAIKVIGDAEITREAFRPLVRKADYYFYVVEEDGNWTR